MSRAIFGTSQPIDTHIASLSQPLTHIHGAPTHMATGYDAVSDFAGNQPFRRSNVPSARLLSHSCPPFCHHSATRPFPYSFDLRIPAPSQVAEVVAGVKELTVEEVIDAVYDNTVRVFPSLAVDESDSA